MTDIKPWRAPALAPSAFTTTLNDYYEKFELDAIEAFKSNAENNKH